MDIYAPDSDIDNWVGMKSSLSYKEEGVSN